jgi:hypothetical protein
MSMSKKDFIALADYIRDGGFTEVQLGILANFCRSQNSRFDEVKWFAYLRCECGPNGGRIR